MQKKTHPLQTKADLFVLIIYKFIQHCKLLTVISQFIKSFFYSFIIARFQLTAPNDRHAHNLSIHLKGNMCIEKCFPKANQTKKKFVCIIWLLCIEWQL